MKKIFLFMLLIVACFILGFKAKKVYEKIVSTTKAETVKCPTEEVETFFCPAMAAETVTMEKSVVKRTMREYFRSENILEVRLQNGEILKGEIDQPGGIGSPKDQIDDFFFVEKGDTIVYSEGKVIEVRFKD